MGKSQIAKRSNDVIGITLISLVINVIFSALKGIIGVVGNSQALIADAVHSLSDFLSDAIIIGGMLAASRPVDSSHRYGHGKFETLAAALLGVILFVVSAGIFRSSAETLYAMYRGNFPPAPDFSVLLAAGASIAAKEILYRMTLSVANKNNSSALKANAWHHRSDALSSVAVLLGSGCAYFLGDFWVFLDPAAGILVGLMVLKVAFEITKESIDELLERSLGEEKNKEILHTIGKVEGVRYPHRLRTRKIGAGIAVDVHVLVDPSLNVEQAHDIATAVEDSLHKGFGFETIVSVHIEPDTDRERKLSVSSLE